MSAHVSKVTTLPRVVYVEVSFTRPNNADAYAAGDAVADAVTPAVPTAFELANCASRKGGGGRIVSAALINSVTGTTNAAFDLVIFDETYTPADDNAAAAPTDAEVKQSVGAIQFAATAWVNFNANKVAVKGGGDSQLDIPFVCKSDSTSLFAQLVARAAYGCAALEVFTIRLGIVQE